ncbi:solute carrier family 22 member 4 [Plakobranchus ocellatus]|uniref:Solute carrier family 22 member 4 n=1 Tax=Plakobranchus ocellatus TaxID=259542 RepID=A0AAV3XWP0_9GAST|nr:solute carrier family 22 member 4 [Plakobranchus ocellatus]
MEDTSSDANAALRMAKENTSDVKRAAKGAAVDDALLALNWWGFYQKLQFLMLMTPVLATVMHSMSVVFIGRNAEHTCAPPPDLKHKGTFKNQWYGTGNVNNILTNISQPHAGYNTSSSLFNHTITSYEKCNVKIRDNTGRLLSSEKCPYGYLYSEPKDWTFVSEWDLVCEKEALSDLSQMVMATGMTVGAFVFSSLSDRQVDKVHWLEVLVYGRKIVYMLVHNLLFFLAIATAFAGDFVTFTTLRFFTGAAQQGVALVSFVLITEQLPTLHRALPSQAGSFLHPTSLLTLGFVAYLTREVSWRYTQLLLSAFSVYVLVQWWIVDESLRWLVANNRTKEAEKLIKKAARQNKVEPKKVLGVFYQESSPAFVPLASKADTDICEKSEPEMVNSKENHPFEKTTEQSGEQAGLLEALKNKNVLKVTAICCYMWFADSASYYGLIMTSSSLVDDLYIGYTVNVLVELPAAIAFVLLINRIGRLKCIYIFNTIGGLSLLIAVCLSTIPAAKVIPGSEILTLTVSLIGKFGISLGYGTMWIYTPELFPTNIRTTCLGVSSVAARIGGMVAPYSRTMGRHLPWGPGVVFAILCLVIPILTLFLPETQGRELPQTIADMDKQTKRNSRTLGMNKNVIV